MGVLSWFRGTRLFAADHFPGSRSAFAQFLAVVVGVGVFAAGTSLVIDAIVGSQTQKRLTQFTQSVVLASETAIDYGFMSLTQVAGGPGTRCSTENLAAFRKQVYLNSNLRDIRYYDKDGKLACSAFPETLKLEGNRIGKPRLFEARNKSIHLFQIPHTSRPALGLCWIQADGGRLVAVLDAGALLFNVIPRSLRDRSQLQLIMVDGAPIAEVEAKGVEFDPMKTRVMQEGSERYPVFVKLLYLHERLTGLEPTTRGLLLFGAGLLGAIFGLLVYRTLLRPDDPTRAIDRGLRRREFVPYLQPIFSLETGWLVGAEVLVRWKRGDRIVQPAQFIGAVESSGRIGALTAYLMAHTLIEIRPLLKRYDRMKIGFNIAPTHLLTPGFAKEVRDIVGEAGVDSGQVVLEITERQEIDDIERAARVVAELRHDGFVVAMDDVGTGHSGLSHIHKLNPTMLKIDKFFVDMVGSDKLAEVVISALVRVALEMGIQVTAEGIEDGYQIARLRELGVAYGQGYFIARPMDIDAFYRFVAAYDTTRVTDENGEQAPDPARVIPPDKVIQPNVTRLRA